MQAAEDMVGGFCRLLGRRIKCAPKYGLAESDHVCARCARHKGEWEVDLLLSCVFRIHVCLCIYSLRYDCGGAAA